MAGDGWQGPARVSVEGTVDLELLDLGVALEDDLLEAVDLDLVGVVHAHLLIRLALQLAADGARQDRAAS